MDKYLFRVAYSEYFQSYIMCTRYVSDTDWSFCKVNGSREPISRIMTAKSKHSTFKWR